MLITAGAPIAAIACDDTGPSPIGDYPDEVDAGGTATEMPAEDAGKDAGKDGAVADAGEDEDSGADAGDAGDAGDAARN